MPSGLLLTFQGSWQRYQLIVLACVYLPVWTPNKMLMAVLQVSRSMNSERPHFVGHENTCQVGEYYPEESAPVSLVLPCPREEPGIPGLWKVLLQDPVISTTFSFSQENSLNRAVGEPRAAPCCHHHRGGKLFKKLEEWKSIKRSKGKQTAETRGQAPHS